MTHGLPKGYEKQSHGYPQILGPDHGGHVLRYGILADRQGYNQRGCPLVIRFFICLLGDFYFLLAVPPGGIAEARELN